MKEKIKDDEFGLRIGIIMERAGSITKLARLSGLSTSMIKKYVEGTSDPSRTNLIALADAAGVNIEWLSTGKGAMTRDAAEAGRQVPESEFVFVPMMQGKISAGGGLIPDNNIQMTVAFRKDWIRRKGDHRNMSMICVQGESMAPTLMDGDMVLVDHNVKAVSASGGIYAITFGDEIMVKRVEVLYPSGQWKIRSDNPGYDAVAVEPARVIVNGKVIWYARSLER
jgi:phage repressor protein C with HTH and peptisase S24 domain